MQQHIDMRPVEEQPFISKFLLKSQSQKPFSPKQISVNRITMLPMMLVFACWSIPTYIQVQLEKLPYSLSILQFNSIYSIGCLPNVFLIFISSWITLKIRQRKAVIVYTSSIAAAQLIMHIAIKTQFSGWFYFFMFGRFLFGFFGFATIIMSVLVIIKFVESKRVSYFISRTLTLVSLSQPFIFIFSMVCKKVQPQFQLSIFLVTSLASLGSIIGSVFCSTNLRKLENQAPQISPFKESNFSLGDIQKLGPIMIIIFIAIFFVTSIQSSITNNLCDMIFKKVGSDSSYFIVCAGISYVVFVGTMIGSCASQIFRNQINYQKIKWWFVVLVVVCFVDIIVLYCVPDKIDLEDDSDFTANMIFLLIFGGVLLNIWGWGMIGILSGIIPLIFKHELLPLAFTVFFSGFALGSGFTPMMIAKIISSSSNEKEGYSNSYYLYFVELGLAFGGLLCLCWNQNNLMLKIRSLK